MPKTSTVARAIETFDVPALRKALAAHPIDLDARLFHLGGLAQMPPPVCLASWMGSADCLRELLSLGASPDSKDLAGRPAAMVAATRGFRECLAALLGAGADFQALDAQGGSILDAAREAGRSECVAFLEALALRQEPATARSLPRPTL